MIDPSLVLHERTIGAVLEALEEEREGIVIARSLRTALAEPGVLEDVAPFFVPPWRIADKSKLDAVLEVAPTPAEEDLLSDARSSDLLLGLLDLTEGNEFLARILGEEWAFLMGQSWIASRTKRTFTVFKRSGAIAIEASKQAFDQLASKTPGVIPTLTPPLSLTRRQRLRAVTKWVAAGGIPLAPLLDPLVGAFSASAAGIFLLFDP
jgi:hypothetical protein